MSTTKDQSECGESFSGTAAVERTIETIFPLHT